MSVSVYRSVRYSRKGDDALNIEVSPPSMIMHTAGTTYTAKIRVRKGLDLLPYSRYGEQNSFMVSDIRSSAFQAANPVNGMSQYVWQLSQTLIYSFSLDPDGSTLNLNLTYQGGTVRDVIPLRFKIYIAGRTQPVEMTYDLNVQTVSAGVRGPALRGPQSWTDCAVGTEFMSGKDDEPFIDVVVYDNVYYLCNDSHTKTANNYPGSTADLNNELWQRSSNQKFVATDVLLSKYSKINNLYTDKVQTALDGPRVEIYGSVIEIFGSVGKNIQFGVDENGYAVLRYFDNAGIALYDLGPEGIKYLLSQGSESTYTEIWLYRFPNTSSTTSKEEAIQKWNDKLLSGGISYTSSNKRYYCSSTATNKNGKVYTSSAGTTVITNGWYCPAPSVSGTYYKGDVAMLPPDGALTMDAENGTPIDKTYKQTTLYLYVSGKVTNAVTVRWEE